MTTVKTPAMAKPARQRQTDDMRDVNSRKRGYYCIVAAMLLSVLMMPCRVAAETFANEDLNYQVVYHWGLIWKHAASATLSLRNSGNNYHTSLTARTVSWADKVYKVRDTLRCNIAKEGLKPLKYVKSSHEGKYEEVDMVTYSYSGDSTYGHCVRTRPGKETEKQTLEVNGKAYDMLSVFYYLRKLNFEGMKENTVYTTNMFSGKKKELLSIRYVGTETVKLRDKSKHQAYHIKFTFTQDGATKSSDDIDTWISMDSRRIPLLLRGRLPVGEIRCYYAASK